jgi:hypothetical protein
MKISCDCGATISDQADSLPQKGHLIPDQEWFPVCDGIDAIINDVAARRTEAEAAAMQVRSILITAARLTYQCRECGRLFVDDRQHQLQTFVPASTETSREILRSRDGHHAT